MGLREAKEIQSVSSGNDSIDREDGNNGWRGPGSLKSHAPLNVSARTDPVFGRLISCGSEDPVDRNREPPSRKRIIVPTCRIRIKGHRFDPGVFYWVVQKRKNRNLGGFLTRRPGFTEKRGHESAPSSNPRISRGRRRDSELLGSVSGVGNKEGVGFTVRRG